MTTFNVNNGLITTTGKRLIFPNWRGILPNGEYTWETLPEVVKQFIENQDKAEQAAKAAEAAKVAHAAEVAKEAQKWAHLTSFPSFFQPSNRGNGFVMFCGRGLTAFSSTDKPKNMRGEFRGTSFQFSENGPHKLCGKYSKESGRIESDQMIAESNAEQKVIAVASTSRAIFWVEIA